MKLSIVIPAYNEEKRISAKIEDLIKVFEELKKAKKLDYEIVVIINKSTDKTEEIVKRFQGRNSSIYYMHLSQKGKGLAVIEGFKNALSRDSTHIGFVDADSATSAKEYARLALRLNKIKADGIIASRYLPGAKVYPKQSFKRIFASRIYNTYLRTIFFLPYRDTQCGAKIFTREAVKKITPHLINTKFAFDVDILFNLKKNGFVIAESPTVWSDASYSKVNFFKDGFIMGLSMLRLRILNSPFSKIIQIYDSLPNWMKIKI